SIPAKRTNKRCAAPKSLETHWPSRDLYSSRIDVGAFVEPACACAAVIERATTRAAITRATPNLISTRGRDEQSFVLEFSLIWLYVFVAKDRSARCCLAHSTFRAVG